MPMTMEQMAAYQMGFMAGCFGDNPRDMEFANMHRECFEIGVKKGRSVR